MNKNLIDACAYAAKTFLFFLLIGALVGSILIVPFLETLTHRPLTIPNSLFTLMLGYVVVGMPFAGITGLLYGIRLAVSRHDSTSRYSAAFACGLFPSALMNIYSYVSNPKVLTEIPLVLASTMLFTGLSAMATSWIHQRAEQKLNFLRPSINKCTSFQP